MLNLLLAQLLNQLRFPANPAVYLLSPEVGYRCVDIDAY